MPFAMQSTIPTKHREIIHDILPFSDHILSKQSSSPLSPLATLSFFPLQTSKPLIKLPPLQPSLPRPSPSPMYHRHNIKAPQLPTKVNYLPLLPPHFRA